MKLFTATPDPSISYSTCGERYYSPALLVDGVEGLAGEPEASGGDGIKSVEE